MLYCKAYFCWTVVLVAMVTGCTNPTLRTEFGVREGAAGRESLHGSGVLSEMFRQNGCRVATLNAFSRRLNDFNVVVWFADDFSGPSDVQQQVIRNWLADREHRAWIWIGRDYNAVPRYTESILGQVTDARRAWLFRAHSLLKHESRRTSRQPPTWPGLFHMERLPAARAATGIIAPPDWQTGVDLARLDIPVAERLVLYREESQAPNAPGSTKLSSARSSQEPSGENSDYQPADPQHWLTSGDAQYWQARILLDSAEGPLVVQFSGWEDYGKLLVVANGSLLMNAGLANRQNRRLAEKIVAECGEGQKVAFLLTDERHRRAAWQNDSSQQHRARWFFAWPLGAVLAHLLIGAAIVVWMYFPIFGKARNVEDRPPVEFARHLEAMGELLRATREKQFADDRITAYLERKREKPSAIQAIHRKPTTDLTSR